MYLYGLNFAVIAKNKPAPKSKSCVGCPQAIDANDSKKLLRNSMTLQLMKRKKKSKEKATYKWLFQTQFKT